MDKLSAILTIVMSVLAIIVLCMIIATLGDFAGLWDLPGEIGLTNK